MKIVVDIPDNEIPTKQDIVTVDLHFIDGKVCECDYPYMELPKGHREYNDIFDHYLCGNCKTIVADYDNFCPNCGADMRDKENADEDSD